MINNRCDGAQRRQRTLHFWSPVSQVKNQAITKKHLQFTFSVFVFLCIQKKEDQMSP